MNQITIASKILSAMLVITCIGFTACQKDISSEQKAITTWSNDNTATTVKTALPFKGRIVGSFVNQPTSDPTIYHGVANASGNVTHLGVFNKVTSDVINIVSSAVEGTFVMTSPSGEQLKGEYDGTFSFGTIPGTFSWVLNATVTGGTGRFSGSTGEFVFLANGNYVITDGVVSGDYTETIDGSISY